MSHMKLEGSWISSEHENLSALLDKLGAPFLIRKLGPRAKPQQKITFEENIMVISTETGFSTKISKIVLDGSQFSDEMFMKEFVATASVSDDGTITVTGRLGDVELTLVRNVDENDQMILTTTASEVICVRKFVRN